MPTYFKMGDLLSSQHILHGEGTVTILNEIIKLSSQTIILSASHKKLNGTFLISLEAWIAVHTPVQSSGISILSSIVSSFS